MQDFTTRYTDFTRYKLDSVTFQASKTISAVVYDCMAYPDFTWEGVKEIEGGLLKVDNIYFNITNWISSYGESALRQTKMAIKAITVRTVTTIGMKIVMRKGRFIILKEKEEYHDLLAPAVAAARCLQAYKCPWCHTLEMFP
jgi:hypothetical protein